MPLTDSRDTVFTNLKTVSRLSVIGSRQSAGRKRFRKSIMPSDPTKLKQIKDIGIPSIAMCVARVPNSGRLIFGSSDFKLHEIDVFAEKPQPTAFGGEGHQSYVTGVVLTAPNIAVSGSYDGQLIWWDVEKREPTRKVKAHELWIRRLVISPDGKTIASVADDMQCKLWNAETGEMLRQFSDHKPMTPHDFPSMLHAVAFSADGKFIATGDKVGHVAIWEATSGSIPLLPMKICARCSLKLSPKPTALKTVTRPKSG